MSIFKAMTGISVNEISKGPRRPRSEWPSTILRLQRVSLSAMKHHSYKRDGEASLQGLDGTFKHHTGATVTLNKDGSWEHKGADGEKTATGGTGNSLMTHLGDHHRGPDRTAPGNRPATSWAGAVGTGGKGFPR